MARVGPQRHRKIKTRRRKPIHDSVTITLAYIAEGIPVRIARTHSHGGATVTALRAGKSFSYP